MSFVYRGLKATLSRHIVTDAEIDRQMERLQQQYPRIAVIKDRPTESGDEVILDDAGFCDGVQFPGGTAEMQRLVLGSGMFSVKETAAELGYCDVFYFSRCFTSAVGRSPARFAAEAQS